MRPILPGSSGSSRIIRADSAQSDGLVQKSDPLSARVNVFVPSDPVGPSVPAHTNHMQKISDLEQSSPSPLKLNAPDLKIPSKETSYIAHGTGDNKIRLEEFVVARRKNILKKARINNVEPQISSVSAKNNEVLEKGALYAALHKMNIFKDTTPTARQIVKLITETNPEFIEMKRLNPNGPIHLKTVHIEGVSRGCASALEAALILKKEHNTEVTTLTLQHPVRSARHASKNLLKSIKPLNALLMKAINPTKWSLEHLMNNHAKSYNKPEDATFKNTHLRMINSNKDIFASSTDQQVIISNLNYLMPKISLYISELGHCQQAKEETTSILGLNFQTHKEPSQDVNAADQLSGPRFMPPESIAEASGSESDAESVDSTVDSNSDDVQSHHTTKINTDVRTEIHDANSDSHDLNGVSDAIRSEELEQGDWPLRPGDARHLFRS